MCDGHIHTRACARTRVHKHTPIRFLDQYADHVGFGELSAFGGEVAKRIFRRFAVSTRKPGDPGLSDTYDDPVVTMKPQEISNVDTGGLAWVEGEKDKNENKHGGNDGDVDAAAISSPGKPALRGKGAIAARKAQKQKAAEERARAEEEAKASQRVMTFQDHG